MFTIVIDDNVVEFYGEISAICEKSTELILQDTLFRVMAMIIEKAEDS